MSYPENFSDYPKSVADILSDKTGDGSKWKPRDALIDALREIDSCNIEISALVICMREEIGPGSVKTRFRSACPDAHVALGLMHSVMMKLEGDD